MSYEMSDETLASYVGSSYSVNYDITVVVEAFDDPMENELLSKKRTRVVKKEFIKQMIKAKLIDPFLTKIEQCSFSKNGVLSVGIIDLISTEFRSESGTLLISLKGFNYQNSNAMIFVFISSKESIRHISKIIDQLDYEKIKDLRIQLVNADNRFVDELKGEYFEKLNLETLQVVSVDSVELTGFTSELFPSLKMCTVTKELVSQNFYGNTNNALQKTATNFKNDNINYQGCVDYETNSVNSLIFERIALRTRSRVHYFGSETSLSLAGKRIFKVNTINLPRLLNLDISKNELFEVPDFSNLKNLKTLNISNNLLKNLNKFHELTGIQTLECFGIPGIYEKRAIKKISLSKNLT